MTADDACIFCRIASGHAPAQFVHADERVIAFLDVAPVTAGHVLVIARRHSDPLPTMPPEDLLAVMQVVQRITAAYLNHAGAEAVNVTQANGSLAGQTVFHTHFHVIPRFAGDTHEWRTPLGAYASEDAMSGAALRVRDALAALTSVEGGLYV